MESHPWQSRHDLTPAKAFACATLHGGPCDRTPTRHAPTLPSRPRRPVNRIPSARRSNHKGRMLPPSPSTAPFVPWKVDRAMYTWAGPLDTLFVIELHWVSNQTDKACGENVGELARGRYRHTGRFPEINKLTQMRASSASADTCSEAPSV